MEKLVFVLIFSLLALSVTQNAWAASFAGHWVAEGITMPGEAESEDGDGLPARLCAQYQLNEDGTFEAVIYGAWFEGTWDSFEPDTVSLRIKKRSESDEYLAPEMKLKDGNFFYADDQKNLYRLVRIKGELDVDELLDEIKDALGME